jgi:hypothetical protein
VFFKQSKYSCSVKRNLGDNTHINFQCDHHVRGVAPAVLSAVRVTAATNAAAAAAAAADVSE